MTKLDNLAVFEKQKALTEVRLEEQKIKRAKPIKMGSETIATVPDVISDAEAIFLGKLAILEQKNDIRFGNTLGGYNKAHENIITEEVNNRLGIYQDMYKSYYKDTKTNVTKLMKQHPLSQNLCQVKGFTEYQLAIIMSYIVDPTRFKTPSDLQGYAGVAPKYGKFRSKATMNELNAMKQKAYEGAGMLEQFTRYGHNTEFQSRMYNVSESLIKAGGYFYFFYQQQRQRLIQRAKNNDECYTPTEEEIKAAGGKMHKDRLYMKGKKNQTIEAWSHANAGWRVSRMMLQFVYEEWMKLKGVATRPMYQFEYLGHTSYITLDEVLEFEKVNDRYTKPNEEV